MQEERTLTQRWAEQDLNSARETAWEILPLLRLKVSQGRDGGRGAHPLLRVMDTIASSQGDHGSHFLRRFRVLDNPVELEQTTSTTTRPATRNSSQLFGFRRSFAPQEGDRGSSTPPAAARGGAEESSEHPVVEGGEGATMGMVKGHEVEPVPLRARDVCSGLPDGVGSLVPFERRYRGEGFQERRRPALGSFSHSVATMGPERTSRKSHDEKQLTPLAQQVLRLEYGEGAGNSMSSSSESAVAVVRALLEPPLSKKCDCDRALHPGKGNLEEGGLRRKLGRCDVRGVVRVEAYLPSSSTTLTLRIQVPTAAAASHRGAEDNASARAPRMGNAKNNPVLPLRVKVSNPTSGEDCAAASAGANVCGPADAGEGRRYEEQYHTLADAGHEEECRSRKQQRRLLWEARATEARRGAAEMLAAVQEAASGICQDSLLAREKGGVASQHQSLGVDERANDDQPTPNNAFSMLLIRANAFMPIERLSLASGSWREAIGQLVGCPAGQELRAVRVKT